jgi:hypothetical protein
MVAAGIRNYWVIGIVSVQINAGIGATLGWSLKSESRGAEWVRNWRNAVNRPPDVQHVTASQPSQGIRREGWT